MRRSLCLSTVALCAFAAGTAAAQVPAGAPAQKPAAAAPAMNKDELTAFAKVEVAISVARDTAQARLAMVRNKKIETQAALRDSLHSQIAEILHHSGLTEADYQRKLFVVTTDSSIRRSFDSVVAKLTGVPTPGQVVAGAGQVLVKVPDGPVGMHIGHVVNTGLDTPGQVGLLTMAVMEAQTAAQHAMLAGRNPGDLSYMKTHAGHVINALDPSIIAQGPGKGYGVKRAAQGVALHINLAAQSAGASKNVVMHANHIATSATNTVDRADQALAIAQKIQMSTSAADAAALVSQLASLTAQLITGVDANGDGKISWEKGEGGLQQAGEHVKLLLVGEGLPTP